MRDIIYSNLRIFHNGLQVGSAGSGSFDGKNLVARVDWSYNPKGRYHEQKVRVKGSAKKGDDLDKSFELVSWDGQTNNAQSNFLLLS